MLQVNFLLGGSVAQQLPCISLGAVDTFGRAPAPTELSDVARGWSLPWLWRLLALGPKLALSCEMRVAVRGRYARAVGALVDTSCCRCIPVRRQKLTRCTELFSAKG